MRWLLATSPPRRFAWAAQYSRVSGVGARALFEVEGPTPLHVRAAVFHRFDGRVWVEAAPARPVCPNREGKTAWMTYPGAAMPDVFADESARHTVKVAKLGAGAVDRLGRSYPVDPGRPHQLVRAEVDLTRGEIRFYRLRRRQPKEQPPIKAVPYAKRRSISDYR
jgi:hypothetical protein